MTELRVDPLTGLKTIIAAGRAGRPGGHFDLDPPPPIDVENDPFALGHEDRTPPEVYAVRPNGGGPDSPGWTVRVVPNLYPALAPDAPAPEPHANPDLYTAQAAAGHHEVIINAPDPVSSLTDLTAEQVEHAMEAWRQRMRAHEGCACRHLIVNERREAGASLPHTHAQLYALRFVPAAIARERRGAIMSWNGTREAYGASATASSSIATIRLRWRTSSCTRSPSRSPPIVRTA